MSSTKYQMILSRLPYGQVQDPAPILAAAQQVVERGLICISIPLHLENPNIDGRLIEALVAGDSVNNGLYLVSKVIWYRDKHIVAQRSKRLTNTYETIAILSRSPDYILNREAPSKLKRGWAKNEEVFEDMDYECCIGDHWPVRNDTRNRTYLPETVILNCAQLGDLHPGDTVYDLFGNPSIQEACETFGWKYKDAGLKSNGKKTKIKVKA